MTNSHCEKLGTVCEVTRGTTITKKTAVPGEVPVVAGGLQPAYFHNQSNRPANIVTVSGSGANAGFVNFYDKPIYASDCSTVLPRNPEMLDVYFTYYFLLSVQEYINKELRRGAAQPHVYPKDLKLLEIPIPPLPEQKRIVAILDEAFVGIDAAVANTEKNLANARELFENYLNAVFIQKGAGWVEKRLDELCTFSSGGTPSKGNSSYWQGEIPWVSGRDMKSTRLSDSALHISQSAVDESATRMASVGTLLILVRGMGLAHGAQIAELLAPCAFNQDIRGIHAKLELLPRYLLFALRDRINSSVTVLSNAAHGTLKIDSNELQKVMVPFPPLDHQKKIVSTIDVLTEETRRLETVYQQKLNSLAELKQSILQKAFAGELTSLPEKRLEEAIA